MSTLRSMVDGVGSLVLNVPVQKQDNKFRKDQDVIIRRQTSRSGPVTSEIMAGKIVSLGPNNTAIISVQNAGGLATPKTVNLKDVSPATAELKRRSIQFSPQHRQRW